MTGENPVTRVEFEELKERVLNLEESLQGPDERSSGGAFVDRRDQAVLDAIPTGVTMRGAKIADLYRRHTDIRDSSTAKERAKSLVQRDSFEKQGGEWLFTGEE